MFVDLCFFAPFESKTLLNLLQTLRQTEGSSRPAILSAVYDYWKDKVRVASNLMCAVLLVLGLDS